MNASHSANTNLSDDSILDIVPDSPREIEVCVALASAGTIVLRRRDNPATGGPMFQLFTPNAKCLADDAATVAAAATATTSPDNTSDLAAGSDATDQSDTNADTDTKSGADAVAPEPTPEPGTDAKSQVSGLGKGSISTQSRGKRRS